MPPVRHPPPSTRSVATLPKVVGIRGEPAPPANQPRTEQGSAEFRVFTPDDLDQARQRRLPDQIPPPTRKSLGTNVSNRVNVEGFQFQVHCMHMLVVVVCIIGNSNS